MADKILNTRILLKYDTLANWQTKNTLLKQGEVAFVQIGNITTDEKGNRVIPPVMFKVGPGNFNDLGWGAATAADVYAWAKQETLPIVRNDAAGQIEGNVISSIGWDSAQNRVIYTTASVATSEGMKDLQDALDGLTNTINGMYTNEQIDKAINDAINALSADGGAIKAVADDLAAHEQAFSEFQTTNTKAIADAVAAEAKIARAAEKANTDAIDAIEADYLKAAHLNDYAKTADVPSIKVNNAGTADKVANALTVGTKTFDGSAAVEVTASDLGLESAMHFIGALSAAPDTAKPGDVYLNTATKKEYVYDTTNGWVELGDEGSYALRTVTITGTDGLVGGGDLSKNRTIGLSQDTKDSLDKANTAVQKVETGATNGTIKVDDVAVSVAGLGSAAYTNSDAYDAAGTAQGLVDTLGTMAKESTDNYYTKTEADSAFMDSTEVDTAISTELAKHAGIDKVGTVTSVGVGEGFKNSGTATDPVIDIIQKGEEGAVTWIFDCGGAE